jgi:hypothetical protein
MEMDAPHWSNTSDKVQINLGDSNSYLQNSWGGDVILRAINGMQLSSASNVLRIHGSSNTSNAITVGTSSSNGNGASLTNAGAWTNGSDRRIKKHIREIEYDLEDLLKLRPVSYEMKGSGEKQIGFIAQEVYEVVPEVVVKPPKEEYHWTMSYGNLVALAVKGIQDLFEKLTGVEGRVSSLEAQNVELKSENAAFKTRLEQLEKAFQAK